MSREETTAADTENKRADWGANNIVCHEHADVIRDLLAKKWSTRLIWDHLRTKYNVTVTYNAFRKAVARWNKKDVKVSVKTEAATVSWVEETREELPVTKLTPVGRHERTLKTNQKGKPRYAACDIETFNGNYD